MPDMTVEVVPGIHHLQFDIPYNVQPVNIYLLEDDPVTLVDTCPKMEGVTAEVPRRLAELGYPPGRIGRIVVTHHHPDHMGLASVLQRDGAAEVVCHRLGEPMVSDYGGEAKRLEEHLVGLSAFMGLDPALVNATLDHAGQWFEVADSVTVDTLVEDGDLLPGERFPLRVVHTPGHTIDHICLLTGDGCLLSGDMLLRTITPNPDIYPPWQSDVPSGLPDYLESLKKVAGLEARVALPGHGGLISDPASRVGEVLEHHEERLRHVLGWISGEEHTVIELSLMLLRFIGMEGSVVDVFLAMREVFGHLFILEHQGAAAREMRNGTAYYHAT